MWVASVEEVAIEILEPSFDVAVQGAQAVDSQNYPCDQVAKTAWRVARVWRYIDGGPGVSHINVTLGRSRFLNFFGLNILCDNSKARSTLTQTRRLRQDGVRERAATSGAAERDAGASARREAEHGYKRGRVYPARASLPGRACNGIAGEVANAVVASTDYATRTTKGMTPAMQRSQKVSIFIDVFYYHNVILVPFSTRPSLPSPSFNCSSREMFRSLLCHALAAAIGVVEAETMAWS